MLEKKVCVPGVAVLVETPFVKKNTIRISIRVRLELGRGLRLDQLYISDS